MKRIVFRLFQPAFVALIVLFWAVAPASWVNNTWTIFAAVTVTKIIIQGL